MIVYYNFCVLGFKSCFCTKFISTYWFSIHVSQVRSGFISILTVNVLSEMLL